MNPHIILRFVYTSGEEDVPRIQYLLCVSDECLFKDWVQYHWKDYRTYATPFEDRSAADEVIRELGEKHAMAVPISVVEPKTKRVEVPSDKVYEETCKRMGEKT